MVHLEFSPSTSAAELSLPHTPFVLEEPAAGSWAVFGDTLASSELSVQVDSSSLCASFFDKRKGRALTRICPRPEGLSVDPGEMDTEMHANALPDADRSTLAAPAAVAERIVTMIERADRLGGTRVEAASWVA